jgi:hypothetical protein
MRENLFRSSEGGQLVVLLGDVLFSVLEYQVFLPAFRDVLSRPVLWLPCLAFRLIIDAVVREIVPKRRICEIQVLFGLMEAESRSLATRVATLGEAQREGSTLTLEKFKGHALCLH